MIDGNAEYSGPMTATHGWSNNDNGDLVFRIEVVAPKGDAEPVFLCEFARQVSEQLCQALGHAGDGSTIKLKGQLVDANKGAH